MSIAPWRTVSSHYLHKDRWITVRADDCMTASGIAVAPYYVLEYPDWAHAVVFNNTGEVLIINQYRHGAGRVCAELPGGIIDPGDISPLSAVQREVKEETGYAASGWTKLATLCPNPATHTNFLHVFTAFDAVQEAIAAPDAAEELTSEFVAIPRLLAMIEDGTFAQAQQVGSVFLALRHAGRLGEAA